MRRCVVVVATAGMLMPSAAAAAARPRPPGGSHDVAIAPHLVWKRAASVTIRGIGFPRRERVRVRLQGPDVDVTLRVHAGPRGRFTATFDSVDATDRCKLFVVTARTDAGLRVRLRRRPAPGCPPA